MDCIFCSIIEGKIDSAKVYEDGDVLAFLDVNPVSKGHCLVVPKKHCADIFDISVDDLKKVIIAAKDIAGKLKENLGAHGINILQSNGTVAGQVVFHFHLHIIPRYEKDGLRTHKIFGERGEKAEIETLEELARKIIK